MKYLENKLFFAWQNLQKKMAAVISPTESLFLKNDRGHFLKRTFHFLFDHGHFGIFRRKKAGIPRCRPSG